MTDFDFEYWSKLWKEDPEEFEKNRKKILENFIVTEATTEESELKLRQTLFRIEATRDTSKSDLESCIKASNLMWEYFHKLNDNLQELSGNNQSKLPQIKQGNILKFNKGNK